MRKSFFLLLFIGLSLCSCQSENNISKSENSDSKEPVKAESEANTTAQKTALDYFRQVLPENTNLKELEKSDDGSFVVIKIDDPAAGKKNKSIFELKLLKNGDNIQYLAYHEFRENGSTGDAPIFFRFEDGALNKNSVTLEELLVNNDEFSGLKPDNAVRYTFISKNNNELEVVGLDTKYDGNLTKRPESMNTIGKLSLDNDGKFKLSK